MHNPVWRKVPEGSGRVTLTPPAAREPGDAPILQGFHLLTWGRNPINGGPRYAGVLDGYIGSDLRMHVLVDPRFEELAAWEDSDGSEAQG